MKILESTGNIEISRVAPLAYIAVASDEHVMLAALTRNASETLMELLRRLDTAVYKAVNHNILIDEINRP